MSGAGTDALAAEIREALRMVIDPELGESVVDLGLVYEVAVGEGGLARIEMTTTTPGCPATSYLKDAVHSAAWQVAGIQDVEVRLTYEPRWTPEMMNDEAKGRLGLTNGK